MKKFKYLIILFVLLAFSAVIYIVSNVIDDENAPQISIADNITYYDGITEQELLKNVSAVDDRDGNVSDTLIVKDIIKIKNDSQVKITFAARDNDNNVAVKSIVLSINGQENTNNIPDDEEATKEPETEPAATEPPTTEVPTTESAVIDEIPISERPVLTLTTYRTEVKKGTDVNWLKYVSDITDNKDSRNELFRRIQIRNYVDINTPGQYEIIYVCSDTEGNYSAETALMVTVTE